MQQTLDGGYIIAGLSYSNTGDVTGNHGGGDYWIIKIDSLGNIIWQKTLEVPGCRLSLRNSSDIRWWVYYSWLF